jgi:hypothetical protein
MGEGLAFCRAGLISLVDFSCSWFFASNSNNFVVSFFLHWHNTSLTTTNWIEDGKQDEVLPGFPERKVLGVGKLQEEEATCKHGVHAFMTCCGYATYHHWWVLLDKATTLRELPSHFGCELQQLCMTDNYSFAFSESDLNQPLWKFSQGCMLLVAFVHTHIDEAKEAPTAAAGPTEPPPAKL